MDVEALSVSEIARMIGRCPHLKPFIDTNDKTPFTDGHIELYADLSQSKATRRGRVQVQVKGRSFKTVRASRQSWRIPRVDLRGYLQESGVLFFFVRVEKTTGTCAAYYVNLAPFKIKDLLDHAGPGTGPVSVPLERLPNDVAKLEAIVALALVTRDQNPETGFDPVLLEGAASFSFYAASMPNFDAPLKIDLASGNVALVLHTAGGMAIPLAGELELMPGDYAEHSVPYRVSSGTTTYDKVYRRRLDAETVELSLGDGVALTLRESANDRVMTVSYRSQGSLAGRLRALEFMRALNATGTLEVDGKVASLGNVISDEPTTRVEDAQASLRMLAELFDSLGVDTDLVDLDGVSDDELFRLRVLYNAVIKGEEVVGDNPVEGLVMQQVGRWRLVILALAGSAPGRWRLVDAFSPGFRRQFWARPDAKDSKPHPVTPYDLVDQENLTLALNLRLGSIVGAYAALSDWPQSTFFHANLRVLALITAGDACQDRRDEFLDAATELNEWLLAVHGAEPQHLVNRWQIVHRRRALTSEERHEIRELKRQMASDDSHDLASFVGIACAILLGDSEEVDYLLSDLSDEDLNTLQKWPIWTLKES